MKRPVLPLFGLLLILFASVPAGVWAQVPGATTLSLNTTLHRLSPHSLTAAVQPFTSSPVSVTQADLHAFAHTTPGVYVAEALLPTSEPDLLAFELVHTVEPTYAPSPLDTLHMSPLEHVFWGRHGFFRGVGLFKTDQEHPVNDLRHIAKIRRTMLSWHQRLGLITVASMATTVIGGQLAISGHGSGLHKASLPFTIGLYATTATLALASPPKLIRGSGGLDTITFHKAFAVLHLAGMILTPMLAPEAGEGTWSRRHIHQDFGYATFAAFSAGVITVTLFQ